MGQSQSRGNKGEGSDVESPQKCYYEALGVSLYATEEEIKKAYRKKALELHPDRNFGHTESATAQFAEVQSAYEVLSNPQERAWYDSHRDEILRNDVHTSDGYDEHNVRVTTTEDITRMYLNFNNQIRFDNSADGFYTVMRELFTRLAMEEVLSCERDGEVPPTYPSFGYENDDHKEIVRPFYSAWSGFFTRKSFAWKNIYRLSEAPDRRTRRFMEKENKKAREQGVRDFNSAVRALVSFVKRRDPRQTAAAASTPNIQLHDSLRAQAATQAARARAVNQALAEDYEAPSWAQNDNEADDLSSQDSESEYEEVYECVICKKTFKSQSQYEAHEKSKKHRKATHELARQMRKENDTLGLSAHLSQTDLSDRHSGLTNENGEEAKTLSGFETVKNHIRTSSSPTLSSTASLSDHDIENTTNFSNNNSTETAIDESNGVLNRPGVLSGPPVGDLGDTSATGIEADNGNYSQGEKRMGKAKQRRAKKEARDVRSQASGHACLVCRAEFPSKTKLFNHLNLEGHAQPPSSRNKQRR